MTKRSRLFATVALPVLSVSLAFEPALADSLRKPFEVAQEESIQAPDGEQVPEELLRKRRKKQDAEQQQEAQPEQQAQPEEQPQEKPSEEDDMPRGKRMLIQSLSVIAFMAIVILVVLGSDFIANLLKALVTK